MCKSRFWGDRHFRGQYFVIVPCTHLHSVFFLQLTYTCMYFSIPLLSSLFSLYTLFSFLLSTLPFLLSCPDTFSPFLSLYNLQVLEPIIKAVTNNFITERNSSDAIAMGYKLHVFITCLIMDMYVCCVFVHYCAFCFLRPCVWIGLCIHVCTCTYVHFVHRFHMSSCTSGSLLCTYMHQYELKHFPYNRLNAVREVCVRCPLVMSRELLADLAGYKTYRDKGVVMAARSLIQLYRNVRPELLQRKDRVGVLEIVFCVEFLQFMFLVLSLPFYFSCVMRSTIGYLRTCTYIEE